MTLYYFCRSSMYAGKRHYYYNDLNYNDLNYLRPLVYFVCKNNKVFLKDMEGTRQYNDMRELQLT